jgi:hypothetical protein
MYEKIDKKITLSFFGVELPDKLHFYIIHCYRNGTGERKTFSFGLSSANVTQKEGIDISQDAQFENSITVGGFEYKRIPGETKDQIEEEIGSLESEIISIIKEDPLVGEDVLLQELEERYWKKKIEEIKPSDF